MTRISDVMNNLFECIDITTLFMDAGLNVWRFITQTVKGCKLILRDAGRPLITFVDKRSWKERCAKP